MIDLPGDPGGATVAWTDRAAYSIFPNSWASEGGGVKIEVASIYSQETPQQKLDQLAAQP